ncbi:MAG: cupin [Leucobacter sp.]|nr:cupin [Leucobacter sp.]
MSAGSHGDVQLENEHFRVTQWTIEPGGAIPMHRHDFEYVVIPLVTDTMRVTNADGSVIEAKLETGVSYTRPAGSEHLVENPHSASNIVFVEVEKLS